MESSISSGPSLGLRIGTGCQVVRAYTFSYDKVESSFKDQVRFIFPPTGHLIFNLFFGEGFSCRLLNYNHSPGKANHLYITGLLSRGSLITTQQGNGGGYAMKVHPVMGYHFLKIPMYELTDRQVRITHVFGKNGLPLRKLEANEAIQALDHHL